MLCRNKGLGFIVFGIVKWQGELNTPLCVTGSTKCRRPGDFDSSKAACIYYYKPTCAIELCNRTRV